MKKVIAFVVSVAIMVGVLVVAHKESPRSITPTTQPDRGTPLNPQPQAWTLETAKDQISEQRIRDTLTYLCSPELEGRMSGKKGNEQAAAWLIGKFKEMGFQPQLQTFKIQNLNNFKEQGNGQTANVIAVLPGGPRAIVIGAHFDHIGYGPSMSRAPNRREIHPGADDNASSIAALLEITRCFVLLQGQNKHTIIFIAFSAEEMGLLGAEHYVNNPVVPLANVDFMFNMDMIGRSKGTVEFLGAGSLPDFKAVAQQVNTSIRATGSAGGGSDHAAFSKKGIPAVFAHTGVHAEYHTPDDTPDRINFRGIKDISGWVFHFCWLMDKKDNLPRVNVFVPTEPWLDHDYQEKK